MRVSLVVCYVLACLQIVWDCSLIYFLLSEHCIWSGLAF
jgi:hypothetical protein